MHVYIHTSGAYLRASVPMHECMRVCFKHDIGMSTSRSFVY
jgi:hypothetical protein